MNLYRHFARLVVRAEPGNRPEIILSREGVVQGCVLGMFLYGITLLPLGPYAFFAASPVELQFQIYFLRDQAKSFENKEQH